MTDHPNRKDNGFRHPFKRGGPEPVIEIEPTEADLRIAMKLDRIYNDLQMIAERKGCTFLLLKIVYGPDGNALVNDDILDWVRTALKGWTIMPPSRGVTNESGQKQV